MLRATILTRIRALGGQAESVLPCPLPEVAAYLVRLESREQAERVAAGLRGDGGERIRRADAVGEGFLFVTPGTRVYELALAEVASGQIAPLPESERQRFLLEYVSADPHAPLSLTHAREAVLGDVLARLLAARGHSVTREFYRNDAPSAALRAFSQEVSSGAGSAWAAAVAEGLTEKELPAVVEAARARQGTALTALGIAFDGDASEQALREAGSVEKTLVDLQKSGFAEERGDSLWLRSSALGDDQDRVLRRGTEATYLAGDLAYHRDKLARGFTRLIDLWDADHRGYIARTHAGLRALAAPPDALRVLVCGPVRSLKDGTEVRGGRYGGFVSLEEVLEELPAPALRWLLLRAPGDSPLDLPLDGDRPLEKIRAAQEKAGAGSQGDGPPIELESALDQPPVAALLGHLLEWPGLLQDATDALEPHRLAHWTETLATRIAAEGALAHPPLAAAAASVLARTLALLGLTEETDHV